MSAEKPSRNKEICAKITSLIKKYCCIAITQVETLCKKHFCTSPAVKEEQKVEPNNPEHSGEKVSIIHKKAPISVATEDEYGDIQEQGSVNSESIAINIERSFSKKNKNGRKRSKKPNNVDKIG